MLFWFIPRFSIASWWRQNKAWLSLGPLFCQNSAWSKNKLKSWQSCWSQFLWAALKLGGNSPVTLKRNLHLLLWYFKKCRQAGIQDWNASVRGMQTQSTRVLVWMNKTRLKHARIKVVKPCSGFWTQPFLFVMHISVNTGSCAHSYVPFSAAPFRTQEAQVRWLLSYILC